MAAVTFHEAVPDTTSSSRSNGRWTTDPPCVRFGGRTPAARSPGLGLYAERLADEMGLYADDWERLGMLDAQIHRAARLVTDTGLRWAGAASGRCPCSRTAGCRTPTR